MAEHEPDVRAEMKPGFHEAEWPYALQAACLEADLTVKVPPDVPVEVCLLYGTLGVAVEIDASLPAFKRTPMPDGRPSRSRKR